MPIGELVPAIIRYRGDTAPDKFVLVDENNEPVDITSGYSFVMTVNRCENPVDDEDQIYQLDGFVTNGPAGEYEFRPSADDTDQEPATYWYDIEVTDPTNYVKTVEKEPIQFVQDITKAT